MAAPTLPLVRLPDDRQANVRASEGADTTTLTIADSKWQVFNLSAARTVVLPTTGVKAGDLFRMDNQSASNALTVQSSGLNTIVSFTNNNVLFVALQDSPTSAAHWREQGGLITSGTQTFSGDKTFAGSTTLGDANTDIHVIKGTLRANAGSSFHASAVVLDNATTPVTLSSGGGAISFAAKAGFIMISEVAGNSMAMFMHSASNMVQIGSALGPLTWAVTDSGAAVRVHKGVGAGTVEIKNATAGSIQIRVTAFTMDT